MPQTFNLYWMRHGLSCSNLATAHSFKQQVKLSKGQLLVNHQFKKDPDLAQIAKKQHVFAIAEQINKKPLKFDYIITSNFIRAIKTGYLIGKNTGFQKKIYIFPYIQELSRHAGQTNPDNSDEKWIRTLRELREYLDSMEIGLDDKYRIFGEEQNYNEKPSMTNFREIFVRRWTATP